MCGTVRRSATLLAVILLASPALATSITNRDDREHKITIIEAGGTKDHTLAPQAVLDGVCMAGCVARLNDSDNDEYELDGNEVVSIEEGYLYYDGPDAPAAEAPATQPKAGTGKP